MPSCGKLPSQFLRLRHQLAPCEVWRRADSSLPVVTPGASSRWLGVAVSPSWLSEVATAAWTGWRRRQGRQWLATPGFLRISIIRRRVCAGRRGTGRHRPLDFRGPSSTSPTAVSRTVTPSRSARLMPGRRTAPDRLARYRSWCRLHVRISRQHPPVVDGRTQPQCKRLWRDGTAQKGSNNRLIGRIPVPP